MDYPSFEVNLASIPTKKDLVDDTVMVYPTYRPIGYLLYNKWFMNLNPEIQGLLIFGRKTPTD